MDSHRPFEYKPLFKNIEDHYVIRILTILPLEAGEDDTSPVRGNIDHVQICDCHLASGEGPESLASRYPTVYFSKHVKNRPEELYETPHSIHVKKVEKKDFGQSLNRVTQRVAKLFKRSPPSNSLPPGAERQLFAEAMSNIVRYPEDTGGGFSMAWVANDSSSSLRQKFKSAPKLVRPPERPHPDFHRKFDFGNYVALSYTWAPETPKKRIYLRNGAILEPGSNNKFGFMDVGDNLDAALRQLRTIDIFKSGLPIWIDALCINQKADSEKGDTEKAEQLKAMSAIYKHAGNIVVWLGKGNETLYQAIDHIQDISKVYRTEWQEAFDEGNLQYAHQHREASAMQLKLALEMWRTMAAQSRAAFWEDRENELVFEFFSLPYWRRLWVIQEMAMGTADMTFILGNRVTEWRYIRDAAFMYSAISDIFVESLSHTIIPTPTIFHEQRLKERKQQVSTIGATIDHVAEIAQLEIQGHRKALTPILAPANGYLNQLGCGPTAGPMRGSVIWQTLRLISQAGCFDPRDRVFGILALPGLPDLGITWDTTKSTVEVYTQFAKTCIGVSSRHPLEFFCLVDGATTQIADTKGHPQRLPSWVPDLASERQTGIIEGTFRTGDKWTQYQIMGFEDPDSAPSVKFDAQGNLQCHGFIIDVVDGLGQISSSDPDAENARFSPGLVQPTQSKPWPVEDVNPETSLWRTFVAGTDDNGRRAPKDYSALLDAFVDGFRYSKTDYDLSPYEFVIDNANFMIDGKQLTSYLPSWGLIDTTMALSENGLNGMQHFQQWADRRGTYSAARQTMSARIKRRRLMLTGKGYLGLVSNSVVHGDVVIIIKGHGRPLIASKIPGIGITRDTYRLKGEAYVDGMMSGEMMEDEHEKTWEDFTFT